VISQRKLIPHDCREKLYGRVFSIRMARGV
jgi:hypothetical protein